MSTDPSLGLQAWDIVRLIFLCLCIAVVILQYPMLHRFGYKTRPFINSFAIICLTISTIEGTIQHLGTPFREQQITNVLGAALLLWAGRNNYRKGSA